MIVQEKRESKEPNSRRISSHLNKKHFTAIYIATGNIENESPVFCFNYS